MYNFGGLSSTLKGTESLLWWTQQKGSFNAQWQHDSETAAADCNAPDWLVSHYTVPWKIISPIWCSLRQNSLTIRCSTHHFFRIQLPVSHHQEILKACRHTIFCRPNVIPVAAVTVRKQVVIKVKKITTTFLSPLLLWRSSSLSTKSLSQLFEIISKLWMPHKYRIYSHISRQFLAQFQLSGCGGRLIRGSCHTARVDSQHDGYLSVTLTATALNCWTNAWTVFCLV